jgi:hypothetical protein
MLCNDILCTHVVLIPVDFLFFRTVSQKLQAPSAGAMILQTPRIYLVLSKHCGDIRNPQPLLLLSMGINQEV